MIASGITTICYALIDVDQNGSSDIWEEQYGMPLPASADPDGDGDSNEVEYNRGTNPTVYDSQYEQIAVISDGVGGHLSQVTFFGGAARSFTLEETTDLVSIPWTEDQTIPGNDLTILVEENVNTSKRFYRVKLEGPDPDLDQDGLDAVEEHLLGSNNLHWDSDGDLMSDGYEAEFRDVLDINVDDASANSDSDSYTNYDESLYGSDPGNGMEIPDTAGLTGLQVDKNSPIH